MSNTKDQKLNSYKVMNSHRANSVGWLVGWLVVFNVPSTARSFRDGTPICPYSRVAIPSYSNKINICIHYEYISSRMVVT